MCASDLFTNQQANKLYHWTCRWKLWTLNYKGGDCAKLPQDLGFNVKSVNCLPWCFPESYSLEPFWTQTQPWSSHTFHKFSLYTLYLKNDPEFFFLHHSKATFSFTRKSQSRLCCILPTNSSEDPSKLFVHVVQRSTGWLFSLVVVDFKVLCHWRIGQKVTLLKPKYFTKLILEHWKFKIFCETFKF